MSTEAINHFQFGVCLYVGRECSDTFTHHIQTKQTNACLYTAAVTLFCQRNASSASQMRRGFLIPFRRVKNFDSTSSDFTQEIPEILLQFFKEKRCLTEKKWLLLSERRINCWKIGFENRSHWYNIEWVKIYWELKNFDDSLNSCEIYLLIDLKLIEIVLMFYKFYRRIDRINGCKSKLFEEISWET